MARRHPRPEVPDRRRTHAPPRRGAGALQTKGPDAGPHPGQRRNGLPSRGAGPARRMARNLRPRPSPPGRSRTVPRTERGRHDTAEQRREEDQMAQTAQREEQRWLTARWRNEQKRPTHDPGGAGRRTDQKGIDHATRPGDGTNENICSPTLEKTLRSPTQAEGGSEKADRRRHGAEPQMKDLATYHDENRLIHETDRRLHAAEHGTQRRLHPGRTSSREEARRVRAGRSTGVERRADAAGRSAAGRRRRRPQATGRTLVDQRMAQKRRTISAETANGRRESTNNSNSRWRGPSLRVAGRSRWARGGVSDRASVTLAVSRCVDFAATSPL